MWDSAGFIVLTIYQAVIVSYQIYFNLFRKIKEKCQGQQVIIDNALIKYNFQYMQNIYILAKTVLINHAAKFQLHFFFLGQILLLFSFMSCLPGVKMVVLQPCKAELGSGYNFEYFFIDM